MNEILDECSKEQQTQLGRILGRLPAERAALLGVFSAADIIAVGSLFSDTQHDGLVLTGELYSDAAIHDVIQTRAHRAAENGQTEVLPGDHGRILDIIAGVGASALID